MRHRAHRLHLAATATVGAAVIACSLPAAAQTPQQSADTSETVTVTGTSIRGVAPVGSNLTSVTPADISAMAATSVNGILSDVPALTGFGSIDSGTTGQGAQQALIHQLGSSANTSTLTLFDGHRVPKSGTNHSFVDPNMLPLNMIGRVDVLADGVSAIYGSDAVAGVVNFIVRKRYDGIQVTGSAAFADGKQDNNASFLAGQSWGTGSALFAYSFTRQGAMKNTARPWTYPDHRDVGSTNRTTFNCDPAELAPSGQSLIFPSATATTGIANNLATAPAGTTCSTWQYGDAVPKTIRNNAMVKIQQNYGSNWTIDTDLLYASRVDISRTARGTLTATAFGAGAQANPFFTKPVGYTGTSTTQTIRWDADALLGPGATSSSGDDTVYGDINVEYRFGGDWAVDFLTMVGRDDSVTASKGTLNSSAATLALNGTTNSGGTLGQLVPNTIINVTQFPLTTATALDVWNPAATNRTSAAVIKNLKDNASASHLINGISQMRLQAQGTVIDLPAGPVKVAFGAELNRSSDYEYLSQTQNAGPTSNAAVFRTWQFKRNVHSAYIEANIPVISAAMGIPFVQSVTVDLSGRFDHYSDFGNTTNPKIAVDWRVDDDLKFRGNWSTSFVAPPEDEVGGDGTWNNTTYGPSTQNASVPVSLFPTVTQMGVPCTTTTPVTCNIATLTGLSATNAAPQQAPALGRGWGIGFDYNPSYLEGLSTSFTFWDAGFKGGSSGVGFSVVATTKSVAHLLTFYPTCATPAQIAAVVGNLPSTGTTPACVQFIFNSQNNSWLNLKAEGIDADVRYSLTTDNWGTFSAGDAVSIFTKYIQSQGDGTYYNVLNNSTSHGSIGFNMRGSVGWSYESFNAQFFMNYTGPYINGGSPDNPVTTDPITGNLNGGGDKVKAGTTFDANFVYQFDDGFLGNDKISLNIRNVFDQRPPFYSSAGGYNSGVSSPLGRSITIGITSQF